MLLALLALLACKNQNDDTGEGPPPPPVIPGAPHVGAAQGFLKLPVGTPLGGFTARCTCLGSFSKQDERTSAYTTDFVPSTGVQTLPGIKVIWLENGDDHLVITKTDQIYSFDGLVEALEARLEEATGERLDGRVIHTTNHSHSSWGTFSDQITYYLGTDKYNEENFQRMVDQIAAVALEAYDAREPAKIGVGWARDWDPDDRVYRDRRGINDDLQVWPDAEPGMGKDPHLAVMRFDALDDRPIALVANFGMHGIIGDADSSMVSTDAGGHLEVVLEEGFDEQVVVMFTQGSGGDASPAGRQRDYARMESIGEIGAPLVRALYDQVPTSADAIRLESASRSIPKHPSQIRVTRGGTVDWRYTPYDADHRPDDIVYDEDGQLVSPIDEFNVPYGAVFCGSGSLDLPVGKIRTDAYPYSNCLDVELLSRLIMVFFELDEVPLPLPESLKAKTTATRLGPVPTLYPDGSTAVEDLLVGFFPGEATAMYNEQWRRRVEAELGYKQPLMISYSQDHEGYLLIPEDWLLGEYEADITVWGPLEGEHIMEGVLTVADEILSTDVHEDPDPHGHFAPTTYERKPLPTAQPDETPGAGTLLDAVPPYLWTPLDLIPDLEIPPEVPRVQGLVQIAWEGGDPGVDSPEVTIERLVDGTWEPLRTRAGRLITEGYPDILLAYTPDPLRPEDFNGNGKLDPEEEQQTHYWWAGWQVVDHVHDRAGLPLGRYRLKVQGQHYTGGSETWPWNSAPYEVVGPEFEVVPASLTLERTDEGVLASLRGPAHGYRLIHLDGAQRGHNPVAGPITVELTTSAGVEVETLDPVSAGERSLLPLDLTDVIELTVTDAYGNVGHLAL